jgi:hypothetical protein
MATEPTQPVSGTDTGDIAPQSQPPESPQPRPRRRPRKPPHPLLWGLAWARTPEDVLRVMQEHGPGAQAHNAAGSTTDAGSTE